MLISGLVYELSDIFRSNGQAAGRNARSRPFQNNAKMQNLHVLTFSRQNNALDKNNLYIKQPGCRLYIKQPAFLDVLTRLKMTRGRGRSRTGCV